MGSTQSTQIETIRSTALDSIHKSSHGHSLFEHPLSMGNAKLDFSFRFDDGHHPKILDLRSKGAAGEWKAATLRETELFDSFMQRVRTQNVPEAVTIWLGDYMVGTYWAWQLVDQLFCAPYGFHFESEYGEVHIACDIIQAACLDDERMRAFINEETGEARGNTFLAHDDALGFRPHMAMLVLCQSYLKLIYEFVSSIDAMRLEMEDNLFAGNDISSYFLRRDDLTLVSTMWSFADRLCKDGSIGLVYAVPSANDPYDFERYTTTFFIDSTDCVATRSRYGTKVVFATLTDFFAAMFRKYTYDVASGASRDCRVWIRNDTGGCAHVFDGFHIERVGNQDHWLFPGFETNLPRNADFDLKVFDYPIIPPVFLLDPVVDQAYKADGALQRLWNRRHLKVGAGTEMVLEWKSTRTGEIRRYKVISIHFFPRCSHPVFVRLSRLTSGYQDSVPMFVRPSMMEDVVRIVLGKPGPVSICPDRVNFNTEFHLNVQTNSFVDIWDRYQYTVESDTIDFVWRQELLLESGVSPASHLRTFSIVKNMIGLPSLLFTTNLPGDYVFQEKEQESGFYREFRNTYARLVPPDPVDLGFATVFLPKLKPLEIGMSESEEIDDDGSVCEIPAAASFQDVRNDDTSSSSDEIVYDSDSETSSSHDESPEWAAPILMVKDVSTSHFFDSLYDVLLILMRAPNERLCFCVQHASTWEDGAWVGNGKTQNQERGETILVDVAKAKDYMLRQAFIGITDENHTDLSPPTQFQPDHWIDQSYFYSTQKNCVYATEPSGLCDPLIVVCTRFVSTRPYDPPGVLDMTSPRCFFRARVADVVRKDTALRYMTPNHVTNARSALESAPHVFLPDALAHILGTENTCKSKQMPYRLKHPYWHVLCDTYRYQMACSQRVWCLNFSAVLLLSMGAGKVVPVPLSVSGQSMRVEHTKKRRQLLCPCNAAFTIDPETLGGIRGLITHVAVDCMTVNVTDELQLFSTTLVQREHRNWDEQTAPRVQIFQKKNGNIIADFCVQRQQNETAYDPTTSFSFGARDGGWDVRLEWDWTVHERRDPAGQHIEERQLVLRSVLLSQTCDTEDSFLRQCCDLECVHDEAAYVNEARLMLVNKRTGNKLRPMPIALTQTPTKDVLTLNTLWDVGIFLTHELFSSVMRRNSNTLVSTYADTLVLDGPDDQSVVAVQTFSQKTMFSGLRVYPHRRPATSTQPVLRSFQTIDDYRRYWERMLSQKLTLDQLLRMATDMRADGTDTSFLNAQLNQEAKSLRNFVTVVESMDSDFRSSIRSDHEADIPPLFLKTLLLLRSDIFTSAGQSPLTQYMLRLQHAEEDKDPHIDADFLVQSIFQIVSKDGKPLNLIQQFSQGMIYELYRALGSEFANQSQWMRMPALFANEHHTKKLVAAVESFVRYKTTKPVPFSIQKEKVRAQEKGSSSALAWNQWNERDTKEDEFVTMPERECRRLIGQFL